MKRDKIACHCRRVSYGDIVDAVAQPRRAAAPAAANAETSSRTWLRIFSVILKTMTCRKRQNHDLYVY